MEEQDNKMNKNNKKISIAVAALLLFLLSSCHRNILLYDTDLSSEDRNRIKVEEEKKQAYRESIKKKSKEESSNDEIVVDDSAETEQNILIDDDYIQYEKNVLDNENNLETDINALDTDNDFPVVTLFKNQPDFDLSLYKATSFETYSDLDSLGRVGKAEAMLGKDIMPVAERESIGMIKPSGWHTVKYDNIDGNYLYNRCHLIGWQLSAENANEKNLFTGTRYLNVKGMLPFENKVANYIKTSGNHVLYRVTPYYSGNNLLPSHIQIEAMSFEDKGEGICFNVKLVNVQPGIHINYADGNSYQEVAANS